MRIEAYRKVYITYQITNKINGRFYRGKTNLYRWVYENYYGSGLAIKYAINKYGKENFDKQILDIFDCCKKAYDNEKDIVKTMHDCPLSYNLVNGGEGFPSGENHPLFNTKNPKISKRLTGKGNHMFNKKHSQNAINLMKAVKSGKNNPMFKYTDEFLLSRYNPDISIRQNAIKIVGHGGVSKRIIHLIEKYNLPYIPNQVCLSHLEF